MPRLNSGQELFRRLDSIRIYRIQTTSPGDTTLTTALTTSVTVATIAATTSFATSDFVMIIGSGGVELNRLGTALSTAQTLTRRVGIPQNAGARFVEATETDLGFIDDGGLVISPSQSLTPINSALSALPVQYISGIGEISATFNLMGFNVQTLHTIMGITESEVGAGSAADPFQGFVLGSQMGSQTTQCIRATGSRYDGQTIEVDLLDARVEVQGQITMNRQAPALMPMAVKFSAMAIRHFT
jgi:hypothetical protein